MMHRRPVGLAAHDDGDVGARIGQSAVSPFRKGRALAEMPAHRKDGAGSG
jgi:hypothetical protein